MPQTTIRWLSTTCATSRCLLVMALWATLVFSRCVPTESFQQIWSSHDRNQRKLTTKLNVLAEPPRDSLPNIVSYPRNRSSRKVKFRKKKIDASKDDVWSSGRWNQAIKTEATLISSLEKLEQSIKMNRYGDTEKEDFSLWSLGFPSIRECNAALAAFGDGQDLLRALRLYFKMRKAASLSQRYYSRQDLTSIPTPTLVTFSTLMSRAVHLGKPLVAIRLWNIMRRQTNFFSACSSVPLSLRIVPDVRAANILMNCYAKLGYVDLAKDLLTQMNTGKGEDVPKMVPNIVSFNTLLDACFKAGELEDALSVKEQLERAGIQPDARTYTTLIATVARKASSVSGANDPTLAFSFLDEMQTLDIRPNGMTYSALIDACGRCRRSDLALKGLRLMADQKTKERVLLNIPVNQNYTLPQEVGAWTAAINACGKTGKIESALKLFYSMPNFGVSPNTITCGCLTDCLLRHGRTADSLAVLRYMKKNHIAASEVLYTSLMTSASRLAQFENTKGKGVSDSGIGKDEATQETSAVEIYNELMASLVELSARQGPTSNCVPLPLSKKPRDNNELYRVSLLFQEMKAAGVTPDLASYNVLLKSCANAGDVDRASSILEEIRNSEDMDPNDSTWREIIRAAGKAKRIDVALSTWNVAIQELNEAEGMGSIESRLSAKSAVALLEALIQGTSDGEVDRFTQLRLYELVANVCEAVISGSSYMGMNLVDRQSVLGNPRAMITFLQALVILEQSTHSFQENNLGLNRKKLRLLAISIVASECFSNGLPYRLRQHHPYFEAHKTASRWWHSQKC